MVKNSNMLAWAVLRPYGVDLIHTSVYLSLPQRQKLSFVLVETLILRFFMMYASSAGADVNRYFFFLLAQKKAYKIDFSTSSFFTYNYTAINVVRHTLFFFLKQIQLSRRLLFIADYATNQLFNLRHLNYLFWPQHLYPAIAPLSELKYYYNDLARTTAINQQLTRLNIDCVVFCAQDYQRVNPFLFKELGRATVGLCSADTRPDLFDYTIPLATSYAFTVSWVVALTLFTKSIN